jgi:hypothetical protein
LTDPDVDAAVLAAGPTPIRCHREEAILAPCVATRVVASVTNDDFVGVPLGSGTGVVIAMRHRVVVLVLIRGSLIRALVLVILRAERQGRRGERGNGEPDCGGTGQVCKTVVRHLSLHRVGCSTPERQDAGHRAATVATRCRKRSGTGEPGTGRDGRETKP